MNARALDAVIKGSNGINPIPVLYDFSPGLKCRNCRVGIEVKTQEGVVLARCPKCKKSCGYKSSSIDKWRNE